MTNYQTPQYRLITNLYKTLPHFAADPPKTAAATNTTTTTTTNTTNTDTNADEPNPIPSKFKLRNERRKKARRDASKNKQIEEELIDDHITWAEDERTELAKSDTTNRQKTMIDTAHSKSNKPTKPPSILQRGRNFGYAFQTTATCMVRSFLADKSHVRFSNNDSVHRYSTDEPAVTYDSGADDNYMSKKDTTRAKLPILRPSSKRVRVADGGINKAEHETALPFKALSRRAAGAHTFGNFPDSLQSVGKTNDDGNVSIFTKDGVTVHKEEDVLITLKGKPILVGARDDLGRYRIPLNQTKANWQPRLPTKASIQHLQQANSVYDLPSVEQGIKWMHAVCGYPVKSTWLKAVHAGNFHGWPLLTAANIRKYYPETVKTPKGHMNQTRKNVRSTKAKAFEECNSSKLYGKKKQDIYTQVYEVRETVFSDQTGQFLSACDGRYR